MIQCTKKNLKFTRLLKFYKTVPKQKIAFADRKYYRIDHFIGTYRSIRPEMFSRKAVLNIFGKFTEKNP